jgi:hypothetical protein
MVFAAASGAGMACATVPTEVTVIPRMDACSAPLRTRTDHIETGISESAIYGNQTDPLPASAIADILKVA